MWESGTSQAWMWIIKLSLTKFESPRNLEVMSFRFIQDSWKTSSLVFMSHVIQIHLILKSFMSGCMKSCPKFPLVDESIEAFVYQSPAPQARILTAPLLWRNGRRRTTLRIPRRGRIFGVAAGQIRSFSIENGQWVCWFAYWTSFSIVEHRFSTSIFHSFAEHRDFT